MHNGIIENYLELKHGLQSEGHRFVTETDTEILAHLVEKHYRGNLETAVLEAFRQVGGIYACVMLSASEPDKIVAARNGPPLVLGIDDGEYFVASDIPALLAHTRNIIFLDNHEIAVLTTAGAAIHKFDGTTVERSPQVITW